VESGSDIRLSGLAARRVANVKSTPPAAKRREMKNRTSASEVSATLGYPSTETVQGLRLWKAFIKLSPSQRSEVLAWVEHLATDPAPVPGGMNGRFNQR
jgi:hypothetical protein